MSHKPRGKGDPPNNNRGNKGGNGNGSGSAPNFSDSNAFGPPLGGRAKPNRNAGRDPTFFFKYMFEFYCIFPQLNTK